MVVTSIRNTDMMATICFLMRFVLLFFNTSNFSAK